MRTVTVVGQADNLSDGDQAYAIQLTGDNDTADLRFANVDPADVSVRNLDYTTKGGFYVSKISEDTDENGGSGDLHGEPFERTFFRQRDGHDGLFGYGPKV